MFVMPTILHGEMENEYEWFLMYESYHKPQMTVSQYVMGNGKPKYVWHGSECEICIMLTCGQHGQCV